MTSSSLKVWRIWLACGLLWGTGVLAASRHPGSRYCYDCVFQQSTGSWEPCRGPIPHSDLAAETVDAPLCPTNCFTKVNPNGDIRRGCYDGTYDIDQSLLGCHIQGSHNDLYCFCDEDRCNSRAPPTYMGRTNNTRKSSSDKYVPSNPSSRATFSPTHPQTYSTYIPTARETYSTNKPYQSHSYGQSNAQGNKNRINHRQSESKDQKQSYEVVYGFEKKPSVYHTPYQPTRNNLISQRRRDYENKKMDNYEHSVDVQSVKENRDNSNHIQTNRNPGGTLTIRKQGNNGVSREYVDHIQRQREYKTTHQVGRELDSIGKIVPHAQVEEPQVEHRQTQHYHKYNVGERTIEHHIVEHYVLHHRIKELLRDQHGLDVHNVDPRQASLIYRLLHPHKAAALDAQMPDTFITE